jgi:NitT/TauT family transport system permease protein
MKFFNFNSDDNQRKRIFTLSNMVYNIFGILIFILLWFAAGEIILSNPSYSQFNGFLPYPAMKAFFTLIQTSYFWNSVTASFYRIIIGLVIAALAGIPLGLFIGFYKTFRELTNASIQFIRMISPLSWMPIAIILLPTFERAVIFIIAISSIWPVLLNTAQGVISIHPEWIKMAKNQGAKDYQLFFKVILPASLPYLLSGFRLAMGIAWVVLVPAEFLGISSGLGYLINDARDTLSYDRLMAVIIAIGLIGLLIDAVIQAVQKIFDWRLK